MLLLSFGLNRCTEPSDLGCVTFTVAGGIAGLMGSGVSLPFVVGGGAIIAMGAISEAKRSKIKKRVERKLVKNERVGPINISDIAYPSRVEHLKTLVTLTTTTSSIVAGASQAFNPVNAVIGTISLISTLGSTGYSLYAGRQFVNKLEVSRRQLKPNVRRR
jgi:hypothetical protein